MPLTNNIKYYCRVVKGLLTTTSYRRYCHNFRWNEKKKKESQRKNGGKGGDPSSSLFFKLNLTPPVHSVLTVQRRHPCYLRSSRKTEKTTDSFLLLCWHNFLSTFRFGWISINYLFPQNEWRIYCNDGISPTHRWKQRQIGETGASMRMVSTTSDAVRFAVTSP